MKEKKLGINKKRIAKAMKPLQGLTFPSIETPLNELPDCAKPEPPCSVWSFMVPALLILWVIGYCYAVMYIRQDISPSRYMTDAKARPDKSLNQIFHTNTDIDLKIEQISSDIENGHWAKADKELHQLKLVLEGNADREPARTKGIDP
jgi:hypothetical protein